VDDKIEWPLPERFVHGGFDLAFGDVEGADPVPLTGMGFEIGLCGLGARFLHGCCPRAIASKGQIALIETCDNRTRKRSFCAAVCEAEEHPCPFAKPPDEPRLGHELQVPADARLALA